MLNVALEAVMFPVGFVPLEIKVLGTVVIEKFIEPDFSVVIPVEKVAKVGMEVAVDTEAVVEPILLLQLLFLQNPLQLQRDVVVVTNALENQVVLAIALIVLAMPSQHLRLQWKEELH